MPESPEDRRPIKFLEAFLTFTLGFVCIVAVGHLSWHLDWGLGAALATGGMVVSGAAIGAVGTLRAVRCRRIGWLTLLWLPVTLAPLAVIAIVVAVSIVTLCDWILHWCGAIENPPFDRGAFADPAAHGLAEVALTGYIVMPWWLAGSFSALLWKGIRQEPRHRDRWG